MSRVGWTKAEYDGCPELAGRLHSRILDLEDAHAVTLQFLWKLLDWGWGENAPDLAKQEWKQALVWAEKMQAMLQEPDSAHETAHGKPNVAQ